MLIFLGIVIVFLLLFILISMNKESINKASTFDAQTEIALIKSRHTLESMAEDDDVYHDYFKMQWVAKNPKGEEIAQRLNDQYCPWLKRG